MLEPENIYHLYNRANGSENLFREEKNYSFFLERYFRYIDPIAETFAYCLMPNHFHVMVRIRKSEEIIINLSRLPSSNENLAGLVSKQFGNLFNSYAKAYNKMYKRNGSLFQRPFKCKKVEHSSYFTQLILYIHNNPIKHGFVKTAMDWPHSSIHQFLQPNNKTESGAKLNKIEVIDWFGDIHQFKIIHNLK